jgi:hypothetical protein
MPRLRNAWLQSLQSHQKRGKMVAAIYAAILKEILDELHFWTL